MCSGVIWRLIVTVHVFKCHYKASFWWYMHSRSLLTTDRAWYFISKVWNRLRQLSLSHDNGQSMVIYHSFNKHVLSVVIVSWQRSDHGNISFIYEAICVSCNRLMTTYRALLCSKLWNMLRQLSLSYDNGQSMVIYHSSLKHVLSVVIVSWQRT